MPDGKKKLTEPFSAFPSSRRAVSWTASAV
jgi:hypothetical protein